MPSGVHDSALIVNTFRARNAHISADSLALLWTTKESEKWGDKYAEQVGSTEVLVHALRHRFFLDCLTQFFDQISDGVFINIGAGFTNYPYLISSKVSCCEIDTAINLRFKQQKLAEFESRGDIPARTIKFISINDLNNRAEILTLKSVLRAWINGRPSFVLFEGVFFYLNIQTISQLYRMLTSLQKRGDRVASTSFRPEECQKQIFQRLVNYCGTGYKMKAFTPTTLPTSFYQQQVQYSLVYHENYYSLCQKFATRENLGSSDNVLEEDAYILERL